MRFNTSESRWVIYSRPLAVVVAFALAFGCGGDSSSTPSTSPPPTESTSPTLTMVASGFEAPLDMQQPNDNSNRFFIVEQGGTIRIVQNGMLLPTAFLNISGKVVTQSESGLLGLAFHPNYAQNRRFYVNYVRESGVQIQTVIAEFQASATNANVADPATERDLLVVEQPNAFNHKGGRVAFGPDQFLYTGLGDGGGENDQFGNGQNLQTLLGKVLRIDVNSTSGSLQYGIPADNPFVNGGGLPEIWAYGFRNPWRFSFDTPTKRLFIGDVGQNRFEEVNLGQKGGNFGWSIMEGLHCFNPSSGCDQNGLILPIAEYDHSVGEAVIGGFVYHGTALPQLQNQYIFADLNGKIFNLAENPPGKWNRTMLLDTGRSISALGQDLMGELYVVDYGNGTLLKLAAQ